MFLHDVLNVRAPRTFWVQTAPTQKCAKHPHVNKAVEKFPPPHQPESLSSEHPAGVAELRTASWVAVLKTHESDESPAGEPPRSGDTALPDRVLRGRRFVTAASRSVQQLVAEPAQPAKANMSEDKHTWDRGPSVGRRQAPMETPVCEMSSCISKRRSLT